MLHQIFDLPELAPTLITLVPFKHVYIILPFADVVVVVASVPTIPAFSAEVAFYMPGGLGVVKKRS